MSLDPTPAVFRNGRYEQRLARVELQCVQLAQLFASLCETHKALVARIVAIDEMLPGELPTPLPPKEWAN